MSDTPGNESNETETAGWMSKGSTIAKDYVGDVVHAGTVALGVFGAAKGAKAAVNFVRRGKSSTDDAASFIGGSGSSSPF